MPPTSSAATVVDDDTHMGDAQNGGDLVAQETTHDASSHTSDTIDAESDAGLELLGKGLKAFTTLIQDLQQLGVEELVLPLPKICVLGDQSTGKSSLIEGISGIKVPRNSGTCTRCPLAINLTTSEPESSWRCSIYLQKNYLYEGSQAAHSFSKNMTKAEGASRGRPLGPWLAQSLPESILFHRTNNKADIPEALRLAQLATLNPRTDPAKFKPGNGTVDERIQVKFSPNVVRVDISAPDVPNLSFYDLPGVINQAEVPEEEYLVKLVANLVKTYIQTDNCLNLLALPMTDDAANSTASKLVQEYKAQDRTIGVLTKPDRVQDGESLEQWVDILNGKKFKLGHGYFVVKNNPDPRVSHAVARQEEEHFFQENEPWAQTLRSHHERFGTLKLQEVLSKRLTAQIRTSLPQITERVRSKTAEVIARLKELPEPPKGNLSLKIFEKILAFEHDLRRHFDGGSEELPFRKEWLAAATQFRDTVAESYPRLIYSYLSKTPQAQDQLPYRFSATPTPTSTSKRSDVIALESDGDDASQPITPTPHSKRKQPASKSSHISPQKRIRLSQIPQHTESHDSASISRPAPHAKRFSLPEIRNILQDAHVGLPNQIDPKATQKMIKESLVGWEEPLKELLRFTEQVCRAMILQRAANAFGVWRGTQFYEVVEETCKTFFEEKLDQQVIWAERILDIERQEAVTLHKATMSEARDQALKKLKKACRSARAKAFLDGKNPGWDNNLEEQAILEKIEKVSENDVGPNPYTHEIRALAVSCISTQGSLSPNLPADNWLKDVRGYYECAFTRFVDVIYQGIRAELFTSCRNELGTALKQRIGLEEDDAEQRCTILLAIDPETERIRIELLKQKANLEKACVWLDDQ
ncbi:MAG: hypothetical protein Q9207_002735 [Kuettlingeria erythrocarpa]